MGRLRARLGIFLWTVSPVLCLLAHCGSDSASHGSADAGDATAPDASPNDVTVPDDSSQEASSADVGAADANPLDTAGDTGEASSDAPDAGGDESSDASDADASDADGSDGNVEATTDATPCIDAGDGAPSCSGSLTCCGAWCTDTTRDPLNCGACGTTCAPTQFCTGVACDDAILKNVCDNRQATVVLDPYIADNEAGIDIATVLSTGCTPGVTFVVADQDAGTAQDPASGRPLTGPGNTLVGGGGAFGQGSVGYMDGHALTTISLGTDGMTGWYRNRKTTMNVVSFPISSLTIHHDYFLLELSVEPVSGTLCFFGIGAEAPGTTAAAYYFRNNVMPRRSTFTDAWYIYEWTDNTDAGAPSAADTFTLTAQGM